MSEERTGKLNKKLAYCRDCGQPLEPGQGLLIAVKDYDWDDPDEDVQGSILKTHWEVECVNRTECAQRVVETGTNIALRRVANDYENLGELAIKAKQILHSRVELALKLALAADEAAREDGWGAIGGPRHGD